MSRLSGVSIVATAIFFPVAIITSHLIDSSSNTSVCLAGQPCYIPVIPNPGTILRLVLLTASAGLSTVKLPGLIGKRFGDDAARVATQVLCGFSFGLGLLITGMASPSKVLAFFAFPDLDNWDPSMMLVLAFGLIPNMIAYQAYHSEPPKYAPTYSVPTSKPLSESINWRVVTGSAAFGIAWGLTGVCPGPGVLRSFFQPLWGAVWLSGFWIGSVLPL
jgi:hypothetical protein